MIDFRIDQFIIQNSASIKIFNLSEQTSIVKWNSQIFNKFFLLFAKKYFFIFNNFHRIEVTEMNNLSMNLTLLLVVRESIHQTSQMKKNALFSTNEVAWRQALS